MAKAIVLNAAWHSRLPDFTSPPGKCLGMGAEYDGRYYAVAIWSPPVARALNFLGVYELRRLAVAHDAPTHTASRLLRIMRLLLQRRMRDLKRLVSYQDTGVHDGTIYKAAGWKQAPTHGSTEWERPNLRRHRRPTQAATPKMRWEYYL